MAREKVTIRLDRAKANQARGMLVARRDVAAYRRVPPTESETALALLADTSGLADDTDWEALYPEVDNIP